MVTGITFNARNIDWLIAHHVGTPQASQRKSEAVSPLAAVPIAAAAETPADLPASPPRRRKADSAAIPPGALLATVVQAGRAWPFRGTISKLIRNGALKQIENEGGIQGVRIDVASIRALAGAGVTLAIGATSAGTHVTGRVFHIRCPVRPRLRHATASAIGLSRDGR